MNDFNDDLFGDGADSIDDDVSTGGFGEALARCAREVADFVDGEGWGQRPQLFALVPTSVLAAAEPALLEELTDGSALTPIQQHNLPEDITGGRPVGPRGLSAALSFRRSSSCRPRPKPISTTHSSHFSRTGTPPTTQLDTLHTRIPTARTED